MAEWTSCALCGQRHHVGKSCPKCGGKGSSATSGGSATAGGTPSQSADGGASPEQGAAPEHRGAYAAAGLLFALEAIINVYLHVTSKDSKAGDLVGIVINVVIAVGLLRGDGRWRDWAILRVALGAFLTFKTVWSTRILHLIVLQAAETGAYLYLLVARPREQVRVVAAVLVFLGVFAWQVQFLAQLESGVNPYLGRELRGRTTRPFRIQGRVVTYHLAPQRWELLNRDAVVEFGLGDADQVLVRPDAGGMIVVHTETLAAGQGGSIDFDAYCGAVSEGLAKMGIRVLGNSPERIHDELDPIRRQRIVRIRMEKPSLEGFALICIQHDVAYVIRGVAPPAQYAQGLEREILDVLTSFSTF